jgi:hypothetical protein
MSVGDDVRQLLDCETGLRCLPRFWKRLVLESLKDRSQLELVWHILRRRLMLLQQFLEPLASNSPPGSTTAFAGFCKRMADARNLQDLARRLRCPPSTRKSPWIWVEWSEALQENVLASLYCVACYWSFPSLPSNDVFLLDAIAMYLTARPLDVLGRPDLAVGLLEGWLELSGSDYASPEVMKWRLQAVNC